MFYGTKKFPILSTEDDFFQDNSKNTLLETEFDGL